MLHALKKCPRSKDRAGFTLLELVVVLAILAIVAGILVVKLPDLLSKANNVAWYSNLVELEKAIAEFHAANYGAYPDGFDSLVTSDGSAYPGIPGGATGGIFSTQAEVRGITQSEVEFLKKAGITTAQIMRSDPNPDVNFGATFFAYGNGKYTNPSPLAAGSKLVFLKKGGASGTTYNFAPNKIRLDDTRTYVVFGIGQACSLIGGSGWSKDCPVLRHNDGCLDPEKAYCRACVIFDVGDGSVDAAGRSHGAAKLVGTVAVGTGGFKYSAEMAEIPARLE